MEHPIDTQPKRAKLPTGPEPVWFKYAKGKFIGYRKGQSSGSWVARLGRKRANISTDEEMDYDEALKAAMAWCDRESVGGNRKYSLAECIDDYAEKLKAKKSERTAKQIAGRLRHNLPDALLSMDVSKLTTAMLEDWLHGMVTKANPKANPKAKPMIKSSANRVFGMLRAALYNGYRRGKVNSTDAWTKVEVFEKADRQRELFLTVEQVDRLLDTTGTDKPFHALLKSAILTGARYGELVTARVKDFDTTARSIKLSGKTGTRTCYLSRAGMEFFKQQSRSKTPKALLLPGADGGEWKQWVYGRLLKNAVRRAKLPSETLFYSLRHYHISQAVRAGISLLLIAKNCGTSIAMIEKHYGHFAPSNMADMMDQVELGGVK